MNTLKLTVTIDIDGAAAGDVRDELAIDADAGELDQAVLNLLREHMRRMGVWGDDRDYRVVTARVGVQKNEVTS